MLGRSDFTVEPTLLRRGLEDNGYIELPITVEHTLALVSLPPLHKEPFDRALVAQAICEGFTLIIADKALARHPGPIRRI